MSFDAKSKLKVFMNKNFESGSTIRLERKKGQMKKKYKVSWAEDFVFFLFFRQKTFGKTLQNCW